MLAFVLDQREGRADVDKLFETAVRKRYVSAARLLRERASAARVDVLMLDRAFAEDWRYVESYKPPRKIATMAASAVEFVVGVIKAPFMAADYALSE
jgi:hypothetical protein